MLRVQEGSRLAKKGVEPVSDVGRDEVEVGEEEGRLMGLDADLAKKAKPWCRQSRSPGRQCGWTRWAGVSRRGGRAAWQ